MENGLLKEKHAIGLLLLEISCVAGIFCRGNWTDVKTKNYGGGGEGRRQWEWPPATNPLRFMKGPFQSCERRSWLTCDVTCFEVWRQPSHNVKQTVAPNSLTLSLLFFFYHCLLLIIKEKKIVYWNGIPLLDSKVNFQIKRLNLFNRSLIWSKVRWSLTHHKTNYRQNFTCKATDGFSWFWQRNVQMFFLLFKNISSAETAYLLLRIILVFINSLEF